MHILITNDDGPPSPHSSPYVASLIAELKKQGHTVSVCLPHTQRSWIGKAHMIGQNVKPLYYLPSKELHGENCEGSTHTHPTTVSPSNPDTFDADSEWVLVDGTPASCVQIGLHHFFADRGPVDLVVSGPNYGRNTTAVFALSSGTLGGALEAAVCGYRAIALSFAFFSRNHDPVIIEGATRHGVRVIEKLYEQWPTDNSVDLYTVNVPLVEGVESHTTRWTSMLQNYWRNGSCFQEVEAADVDRDVEEERIREGAEGEVQGGVAKKDGEVSHSHRARHFKWSPKFGDVYKSVEEAGPGNDGWSVKEGETSVTPLKANFWHAASHLHDKELVLEPPKEGEVSEKNLPLRQVQPSEPLSSPKQNVKFYALIDYEDDYVQPLILSALNSLFDEKTWTRLPRPTSTTPDEPIPLTSILPDPTLPVLQITPYESIDFDHAAAHPKSALVNSYVIRKALIRKHYLSATVEGWVAKNPDSALNKGVKRSEHFEVDYAEFLDDALVEAFDLRESMDRNEGQEDASAREWWILKPGMSDRGQGIRLFSTIEQLQDIFDGWEEDEPDSDEEEEEEEVANGGERERGGDHITTSHLRHFIVQPYIHPPLLLAGDGRKFHLRVYALAVGCLKVYVYSDMLALFAGKPYRAPWEAGNEDLDVHLTNTCLQSEADSAPGVPPTVRRLRDLVSSGALPRDIAKSVTAQIRAVTGDLFEAAARGMPIHFQPLGNGFEVFGIDFLVDEAGMAWLLEVNSFPDFKQSGAGETGSVVEGFWRETVRVAVGGFFGVEAERREEEAAAAAADEWTGEGRLDMVRNVELGRR